jgi:hypothetical protein
MKKLRAAGWCPNHVSLAYGVFFSRSAAMLMFFEKQIL